MASSHREPDLSSPLDAENTYVHDVYNEIASHFSQTRYKPWPIVKKYLEDQTTGSIGLDVGCGNGKYLQVNPNISMLASDRSSELVQIAHDEKKGSEVMIADALHLPYQTDRFDFAISIAVIHHFSTPERRIDAVKTILSTLTNNGTALIYVWALEQKNSRRGWDSGMNQDVFVPWVDKNSQTVKERYYHLYKEHELESDVISAGGEVVDHGYERDNWWVIMKKRI